MKMTDIINDSNDNVMTINIIVCQYYNSQCVLIIMKYVNIINILILVLIIIMT